jgi:hypothetical protein
LAGDDAVKNLATLGWERADALVTLFAGLGDRRLLRWLPRNSCLLPGRSPNMTMISAAKGRVSGAYAKAKYLHDLYIDKNMSITEIEDYCGGVARKREIENYI